jgi:hypothetical protein
VGRNSGVESKERVSRVHKPLFLVRLRAEDGQPHIERRKEDNSPQPSLESLARRRNNLLKDEQWQGRKGKNKPEVEVEGQVLEVKRPRLCSVELWTMVGREDIVLDNVPCDRNLFLVKEEVYKVITGLSILDDSFESEPQAKLTRRRQADTTPRPMRTNASHSAVLSPKTSKMSSSSIKGAQRAAAKGHPRIPAAANQNMP